MEQMGTKRMPHRALWIRQVLASLEKQWAKVDQEVFILAVFLNPYICHRWFSHLALTDADLYNMAARVFKQIFGQKVDIDVLKAFTDYSKGQAEFSDERMSLVMIADMHASEVSHIFNLGMMSQDWQVFVRLTPWPRTHLDSHWYWLLDWSQWTCQIDNSYSLCYCQFSRLQHSVISVTFTWNPGTNSMPKRFIKPALSKWTSGAHVDAGFIHPQHKWAFGETDNADSEPAKALVPDTNNSDFDKLTRRLVRDSETAEGDDDGKDCNFVPTICVPPFPQQSNSSLTMESTERHPSLLIPLKSLFNYNMTSNMIPGTGLDFYWKGGLKNLNWELAAYDLLCEEEDKNLPDEDGMMDGMDHANWLRLTLALVVDTYVSLFVIYWNELATRIFVTRTWCQKPTWPTLPVLTARHWPVHQCCWCLTSFHWLYWLTSLTWGQWQPWILGGNLKDSKMKSKMPTNLLDPHPCGWNDLTKVDEQKMQLNARTLGSARSTDTDTLSVICDAKRQQYGLSPIKACFGIWKASVVQVYEIIPWDRARWVLMSLALTFTRSRG